MYNTRHFGSRSRMAFPIACTKCVLPSPGPPYRKNGLYFPPGCFTISRATPAARSLFLPTTKLSKVYFEFSPVLNPPVGLRPTSSPTELIRSAPPRVIPSSFLISRDRTLVLPVDFTVKSILVNSILLCLNASISISRYFDSSCLVTNTFGAPIVATFALRSRLVSSTSLNHVLKEASETSLWTSANTFWNTSNMVYFFDLLNFLHYTLSLQSFPQVRKKIFLFSNIDFSNREQLFHLFAS